MTPQPVDPTKTYTATYDAWNRLVKLVDDDTDDTVAEYQYDGANRRIVQKSYDDGDLDETRHLYYTQPSQWQVVEERVDDDTDPDRQFVWGLRYIDDLILRDRDTNGDGTLNERLYALQDANWNLTALIDTAGDVQERCAYSAYGTPLFLTPSFGARASSTFDWETLYAGYRWETLTELFHVRHRVLNSVIGTWCQRDPLHIPYTIYTYGQNAPARYLDPAGLEAITVGTAIVIITVGGAVTNGIIAIWATNECLECHARLAKRVQDRLESLLKVHDHHIAMEKWQEWCEATKRSRICADICREAGMAGLKTIVWIATQGVCRGLITPRIWKIEL